MKWGLTSLGAALAVATALALVPVGGSSGQTGDRTITLFGDENGGTYGFVDNPPRSPASDPTSPKARFSMGDQGYWTGIIRDRKGGRRAGTVFGTETVLSGKRFPHVTNIVHAVFALTDGQIIVEHALDESRKAVPAAVIGGTGAYAGATGTLLVTPARGGNEYTITLLR
jgi:hypothetical protein